MCLKSKVGGNGSQLFRRKWLPFIPALTDAIVVSSDARSLTDLDALASRVKAEFVTFDLLFVNAGFSIRAPLESITEAVYDEMFNLNAKGPLFAVQKLTPLINRGGSVVLTTSTPTSREWPAMLHTELPRPRYDHSLGRSLRS